MTVPLTPSRRAERLTERFYDWERRGRGWNLFEQPVELEPVFRWPGIHTRPATPVDDTRKAHWLARLFERKTPERVAEYDVPEAFVLERSEPPRELVVTFPPGTAVPPEHSAALLSSLTTLRHPLSFEVVSEHGRVRLRFACVRGDEALLASTLRSIAPGARLEPARPLVDLWLESYEEGRHGSETAFVEFGLGREFMLPLGASSARGLDTLAPLVTGLASCAQGLAVLQTLFVPTEAPWAEATLEAVTTPAGKPFFADAPEVTKGAAEKLASPLFAAALRLAVKAESAEAAYDVVRAVAGGLSRLASPSGNELVPLASGEVETLVADMVRRTSHRTGMLLSARELSQLVRLPSAAATTTLVSPAVAGKAAPDSARHESAEGVRLGMNKAGAGGVGAPMPVYLREEERLRHVHVIGASGTGKSTLLVRLILQDVEAGRGVAVFDPHGDLVDEVLARLPERRLPDAIVFDPSDTDAVVGWNVLSASGETERQLLASDLVSVFRRLATSWGDQMTTVLANAILAFLDSPEGGTLLDLRRFLVDKAFRERIVGTLPDPHLRSFWGVEFPMLVGRRPQAPILTRLDTLLRHRLVRDVVTMREGALYFRAVMDERRVFLARLAQGAIGRENAALLGSLLASRFHHTALARQDTQVSDREAFFLYLDEFHELATPSMATLFSGIRKYGVGLTVAHHSLHQLRSAVPEVERAVLDNAHTRVVFRVGEDDARRLASGFSGFDADDVTRLSTGEAIVRIGGSGNDFDLQTEPLPTLDATTAAEWRERARAESRQRWARPRPALEAPSPSPPSERGPAPASPPLSAVETPPVEMSPAETLPAEALPTPEEVEALIEASAGVVADAPPNVEVEPVRPEGRGGPQHRYLQSLLREWAQTRGYRADLEVELEDGSRVDLVITRERAGEEPRRIACEISVSTGREHELEHARRYLQAGFDTVAIVSLKRRFLEEIERDVAERFSESERERVIVASPETFLAWLEEQPLAEHTVAGYTVKTQLVSGTEAEARRKRLTAVLGKSLKRLRGDR